MVYTNIICTLTSGHALCLRLKVPIALVLPDVFILANKSQTFSQGERG